MKSSHGSPAASRQKKAGLLFRIIMAALVGMAINGCASLMQSPAGGESAKKYQEANALSEQGKYQEARDAYRELAEKQPASSLAEQAKFNAAYMLVYHRNPDRDYAHARREFEEFLTRYPKSRLAGDAASWLEMLKNFEQSKINEFMREIDSLTKKLDSARIQQQETQSSRDALEKERDALAKERDALLKGQAELTGRIEDLLRDKDALSQEKAAALHENEKLNAEKAALEKKAEALAQDNEKLTAAKERLAKAKEKLEKRLRDLSMVDVKLEKKRKKVK